MNEKLKSIANDKFLKNNFIFFCGSSVVAVFNYLYHPVLGRMMSIEEFGEVQTLISLFMQLAIIVGVFKIITVNIVSNQDSEKAKIIILMLQKLAFFVVAVLCGVIIILSPFLKSFFHFNSFYPFISLAVILGIGLVLSFREAILQGVHNFKALSISSIILSSGRLVFAVVLVYFGWSSFGAISAIIIAQSIALIYVIIKTRHTFNFRGWNIKIDSRVKPELKYGFLIFAVTLCIAFLYTADVMIVKHYFPADIAGHYSGISVIARIIFFITGSTVGVLLPSIKMNGNNKENSKTLQKAIFLILALGGTTLIVFALFPEFVINLLIGNRYLAYANLLPRLSLLLFLVSIINLLSHYLLALRNYGLAVISVLGISVIALISFFHHNTLIQVINNFLFGSIGIISLLIFLYFRSNSQKQHETDI